MRNKLFCFNCRDECFDRISEESYLELECPWCEGGECDECDGGFFRITQCARRYVGPVFSRLINTALLLDVHLLQAGGWLDQSAWVVDLYSALKADQGKLDDERYEQMSRGL